MITTTGFYTAEQVASGISEDLLNSRVFMMQNQPDAGWYIGSPLGAQSYAVARDDCAEFLGTVAELLAGDLRDYDN